MIVVAGGSGTLGRSVVGDLVARGERVRVFVRDPARARAVLGDAVEVVAGDVRRPDDVDRALAGAAVVVSAVHGFLGGRGAGPAEVDHGGNVHLIDAAGASGAGVVLVSVIGAAPDSRSDLFRAKHTAEEHLRAGVAPWTIVRAAAYLETWLAILTRTAGSAGRPLVFGRGDRPIPFVSAVDVAAVVARAAVDPTWRGQVLDVAGEPLTMTELARALQDARRWRGSPRHLPRPLLRTLAVLTRPVSPAFARQNRTALDMDTGALGGDVAGPPPDRPAQQLIEVLARSGTT